jgi:RHS repeat-associated protein
VDGVLVQGFLWQGQLAPVAELDSAGEVVSRFVYATRVNVPDYIVKNDSTYRLVLDHLGSVRLVVNTSNDSVVQRLDYDEFGVVTLNTDPGFQPFGFAGGLYDQQTGLVRFGARDYDAETGRWTAKDPIGFSGGDGNLFAYAGNDPISYVDPDGRIIPVLLAAWGLYELGSSAYDIFNTIKTALDPCASTLDKLGIAGFTILGLIGPGGGYSRPASKILRRTERQLQKGFSKHAADFGLTGNWNPSRAADFSRAIHTHINSPDVREIAGIYRGIEGTNYLNPSTGLNVFADAAGNFVTGFRLTAEQLSSVLNSGRLF